MIEKNYEDFFAEVKKIQETQKKQKQRGLNDYNMVNVVRNENAEVGMHSNVIYSLINPDGLHYQEDLFLNLFIEKVLGFKIDYFGEILSVNVEEATKEGRRVDFTIKSTKYYVGIEMKIDACDLPNQIFDYYVDLSEKAKKDNNQEVVIYYLSKIGTDASKESSNGKEYRKISFKEHILNWINACQKEVRNITNLNESFENYKNIVEKIVNKYKGKVMALEDKLLENIEYFELAHEVSNAFRKAQPKFIERCVKECIKESNLEIEELMIDPRLLDIKINKDFTIRILINDELKYQYYLIQIFPGDYDSRIIEKQEKNEMLTKLKKIDTGFQSAYNKVYGQITIKFDNFKIDKFKEILLKLFSLAHK